MMPCRSRSAGSCLLPLLLCVTVGCAKAEVHEAHGIRSDAGAHPVTAVHGESWLKHLGLTVAQTRMGEMGGLQPAAPSRRSEPESTAEGQATFRSTMRRMMGAPRGEVVGFDDESFVLSGADLYRLNCQSCHGPDGTGSPPEINSLIGPVQATSAALLMDRMKKGGKPIPEAMAEQLAAQSEVDLRQRLLHGGEKMPPFEHLRGDEVDALIGYLQTLAGLPPSSRSRMLVRQSAARVGEHLVKGTCHICHDATGPGRGRMMMSSGVIPSLASMPQELTLDSVIRQVHDGSSGMMGMMGGPQMPPLPYLTPEETAAAYVYLEKVPPQS